jgi:hypothetical protein
MDCAYIHGRSALWQVQVAESAAYVLIKKLFLLPNHFCKLLQHNRWTIYCVLRFCERNLGGGKSRLSSALSVDI